MQHVRFGMPAILDVAAAGDLLRALQDAARNGAPLCLNASAVETCTLPYVQIVLAALNANGQTVIEEPSAEFVSVFEDLGLDWGQGRPPAAAIPEPAMPAPIEAQPVASPAIAAEPAQPAPSLHVVADLIEPAAPSGSKRILTIDDSKTMRDMLRLTLADAGFDVLQAVDGQDGLDVLGRETVDVIITDINMPRMDGYEVIRHLRRNPAHKTTPVLVLTTESELEKKNLARECGATGWMVKPFDPERLISTINKVAS